MRKYDEKLSSKGGKEASDCPGFLFKHKNQLISSAVDMP